MFSMIDGNNICLYSITILIITFHSMLFSCSLHPLLNPFFHSFLSSSLAFVIHFSTPHSLLPLIPVFLSCLRHSFSHSSFPSSTHSSLPLLPSSFIFIPLLLSCSFPLLLSSFIFPLFIPFHHSLSHHRAPIYTPAEFKILDAIVVIGPCLSVALLLVLLISWLALYVLHHHHVLHFTTMSTLFLSIVMCKLFSSHTCCGRTERGDVTSWHITIHHVTSYVTPFL